MKSDKLQNIRFALEKRKGYALHIQSKLIEKEKQRRSLKKQVYSHEKAREILKEVGLATQRELEYHISDITSLALTSIFEDPYELNVEFVERRNQSECDLTFKKGDSVVNPLLSSGGGAVDVAAFALRIASWTMMNPRPRALIILDEPFRFLSENYQPDASSMIKELSQRLGLQFIIVSHEVNLTDSADKIIEVSIRKRVSNIK